MIIINLDVMLARRKISSGELAARVGITPANLSILKTGKAKALRLSTLEAICRELHCQPGDVLEFREEEEAQEAPANVFRPPEIMEGVAEFYRALTGEEMPGDLGPRESFFKAIERSVEMMNAEEEK